MVLEARKLVDESTTLSPEIVQALNALGYDEAAQHVYGGMTYGEWKKRHQAKASDDQVAQYNAMKSTPLHAQHDPTLLQVRAEKPSPKPISTEEIKGSDGAAALKKGLLSSVCCEDVEQVATARLSSTTTAQDQPVKKNRTVGPFQPPPLPRSLFSDGRALRIGILTVSDRAFRNEYQTGDLSGPAVNQAIQQVIQQQCSQDIQQAVKITTAIVPDDVSTIQLHLQKWSEGPGTTTNDPALDIILTTGGTGMSPRDVTPEATRAAVDLECAGLMTFVTTECAHGEPLSSLSRGTAGIRNQTIIANLPGHPKAVGEVIPLLLPLLMHALVDLRSEALS